MDESIISQQSQLSTKSRASDLIPALDKFSREIGNSAVFTQKEHKLCCKGSIQNLLPLLGKERQVRLPQERKKSVSGVFEPFLKGGRQILICGFFPSSGIGGVPSPPAPPLNGNPLSSIWRHPNRALIILCNFYCCLSVTLSLHNIVGSNQS